MRKSHFEQILRTFPSLAGQVGKRAAGTTLLSELAEIQKNRPQVLTPDRTVKLEGLTASIMLAFARGGAPIFKFAREFSEELAKVNLDVPASAIPTSTQIVCIEFPDNMRFLIRDLYAHCVYLHVAEHTEANSRFLDTSKIDFIVARSLQAYFPLYSSSGQLTDQLHTFGCLFESDNQHFSEALNKTRQREITRIALRGESDYGMNRSLHEFVMKAYLYLHSGEPDLRAYRAPKQKSGQRPRSFLRQHENDSLVDMTLVGFNFKKPVSYTVGSTQVTGHFRWQPFGPKLSMVKLIWIEPYPRTFGQREQSRQVK